MFSIENLQKYFVTPGNTHVRAVDGISLAVETGKLITLLGPSGCGKTTTLRCLAGLERPETGRIVIGNNVVFDSAQQHLRSAERPRHRHGVPVLRDLAAHDGVRERRFPIAGGARSQIFGRRDQAEGRTVARNGAHERLREPRRRRNSPAASSSAWLLRAAWCASRRSCCSTSRCPISTPSCANRCAWS